jgi:hypothetical protein
VKPSLSIEEFGKQLLETNDLDPIYVMLRRANMEPAILHRWLVAYWCFYHAGVASKMAEAENSEAFWCLMERAAANLDGFWPRGTERRHFRGSLAIRSVARLQRRYSMPSLMISYLTSDPYPRTYKQVAKRVEEHTGFGPWIAWKAADMLERCLGWPIQFDESCLLMFDDPQEGAFMAGRYWGLTFPQYSAYVNYAVERLAQTPGIGDVYAPPSFDRKVNIQEFETILCKWKSHKNGKYPIGKDSKEILHHLEGWGTLASSLRGFVPTVQEDKAA